MNIYEVVFWGSHGDGNAEDTIYLVRAPDFRTAVEDVQRNGGVSEYRNGLDSRADNVHEVGVDLSPYAEKNPCILRGPYFAFAVNRGWRSWSRKMKEGEPTNEWVEDQFIGPKDPMNANSCDS